jgi:hypothetical protein
MGAPTGSIFISCRRGDAPFAAHALHGQLARRFAEHRIFMDVQGGVYAGAEFADVIREQVARCEVLVALIGPDWDQITDDQGRRRLDIPDDLVRIEIASALSAHKRVVPVLVGGAIMPAEDSLPDDLKALARRNAFKLTHENFATECAYLVRQIEMALLDADGERFARRYEQVGVPPPERIG